MRLLCKMVATPSIWPSFYRLRLRLPSLQEWEYQTWASVWRWRLCLASSGHPAGGVQSFASQGADGA